MLTGADGSRTSYYEPQSDLAQMLGESSDSSGGKFAGDSKPIDIGQLTDGSVTLTVTSGETVGELSARYGVSEKQILAANPQLRHPDDLSEGQEIRIPVMDNGDKLPSQVQMHWGDTLTGIAKSHGVSVTFLASANGIADPNQVRAGTTLWIPVKGVPEAGVATSANLLQPQIFAVDSAVKQYQAAHNGTQRQAASAALTQAVEQELGARAAAGLPRGQLPSSSQLAGYGTAIGSCYASDPGITRAIQQGVTNESAAVRTSEAVRQAKAVNRALQAQAARADIQAQRVVAQARSADDPAEALTALNHAYTHASSQVQQRILAQADTQAIFMNAAARQTQPLDAVEHSNDFWLQAFALRQSLGSLDKSAVQLDPTLAAGLVSQALPALNQFNSQYARQYGGSGIASDPLHAGAASVATVMDLSAHISGTPQGEQDIAQLARIGFWNNGAVSNALYGGASAAYPEAMARLGISQGQDPTNVMSIIQEGVQADQQQVQSDVQALGQHNAQLSWLVQNIGPSMSPQQLQTAVSTYESQNGWSRQNLQLTQKVVADATTLQQNMNSLSGLAQADPEVAASLNVQETISSALNDKVTSYGLVLAAGQNPGLYADSNGQAFLNLVSGLKFADQGRKTAQLIGSLYVRSMVTSALKNDVDWTGENPLGQAHDIINSLKSPALSNWMGVNDDTVWNAAKKAVRQHLVGADDDEATVESKLGKMDQALNKLKALSASSPAGQLLRSVAVAYAFANTVNSYQKFRASEGAPDKTLTLLDTWIAAAGLGQKGINLANGFGLVKSDTLLSSLAKDTANGAISVVSGSLDLVEGILTLGGWGEKQNTGSGVFSTMSGVGGIAYGASQFAESGIFDAFGAATFGVAGGAFAAGLGLVGVGIVAVSVLGSAIYEQNQNDHQYEGASKDFLQSGGGYSLAAASALGHEGGLFSGSGGVSGVPFLVKYASMEHLSTGQLQQWVDSLTSGELQTLDQCLLQTAGDSNGDPANFTDGPAQETVIADSGGVPAIVTLTDTLGVFQNNLKSGGVPLPS